MATRQEPFNAVEHGSLETVGTVNNNGNLVHAIGNTALHWACWKGHLDMAHFFLQNGADVNAKDKNGWTALHEACRKGHSEVAQLLLENGADVDIKNNCGYTTLHEACYHGQLEVVRFLLQKGADVNAKNNNSSTALHLACRFGFLEVSQLLLENGTDVNTKNKYGWTALDLLNKYKKNDPNHGAIMTVLIEARRFGKQKNPALVTRHSLNSSCRRRPCLVQKPQKVAFGRTAAVETGSKRIGPSVRQLENNNKNDPNFEAIKTVLEEAEEARFGKTPAQLFLSSPIFERTAAAETSSKRIGMFVEQLEKEASRTPNTTDVDALRALGYCHDHGIQVEQDSKLALELYLRADAVSKQQPVNSGHKMWGTESCAAWLHSIGDPRVSKFATRAELNHHISNLKQLMEGATSSIDMGVLKKAAAAKKEVLFLESLLESEEFRSLESLQAEVGQLTQNALAVEDFEERMLLAQQIKELQERCQEEEQMRTSLGLSDTTSAPTPPTTAADPTGAEPYDVFLVHTGVDKRTVVFTLKQALSSAPNGFRCFLDQDDLDFTTGSPTENMRYSLETCRYSIVVVSKEFLQRKDPCAELAYSFERREWLREHGIWQSLCVILYDITVEEYKQHCKSAPFPVPEGLVSAVTMVLWNSKGCEYKWWDDVCQHVKERLVAHDREKGAVEKWNKFLERRRQNDSPALSSFPRATDLYEDG